MTSTTGGEKERTRLALSQQQQPDNAFPSARLALCFDARIDGQADSLCLGFALEAFYALFNGFVRRWPEGFFEGIVRGVREHGRRGQRRGKAVILRHGCD